MTKRIRSIEKLHSLQYVVSNENLVYDVGNTNDIPCLKEFIDLMQCLKTEKICDCSKQYSTFMTCLRKHGFNR